MYFGSLQWYKCVWHISQCKLIQNPIEIIYSHYSSKVQHYKRDIKIVLPIYYSWETTRITEDTSYYQNGGIL